MRSIKSGDVEMPILGFGTWQLEPPQAQRMVEAALEIGYRHIDTAWIYHNEQAVGDAIKASGVPRSDIFLTTKVWVEFFQDGDMQSEVAKQIDKLGGPVDLLLLHWPKSKPPMAETFKALNEIRNSGLTRAIGVSNYPSAVLKEAARISEAPIATNQVEYHPYLPLETLKKTAREIGASITAWSPLAQGKIADEPVIKAIAEAHGKTPGQVTLRWLIQQDVIAIPRTTKESRARENFEIFDFTLSDEEMARIYALTARNERLGDWIDKEFKWDEA